MPHHPISAAFTELPSGAVMPEGRWKAALERVAEGWLRRVVEARDPLFYPVYWERNTLTAEFPGDVHAEWAGYVGDAIIRLAHLLPDSWIAAQKAEWLERVLASQEADGYLGAYRAEERWRHGFELWSQDRLLQALICEYEHSGERRVLDACLRAARRIGEQFKTPEWVGLYARPRTASGPFQAGHSLNIIHPLLRLAELSGEESLRELALAIYLDYDAGAGEFCASRFLAAERLSLHIVTLCEHLSIPATLAAAGGPGRWREASLRAVDLIAGYSLQVTGAPSGNEATYGRGPRKFTEHCGVIEWAISCSRLLGLTGAVRFADLAERAMANAYFGAQAPDGATLAYNHAPNQLVAADWSAPYEDNWDRAQFRAHYSAHHEPRCCNANTSRALPNFIQRAAMRTPGGGLALVYYGPCRVRAELPGRGEARLRVVTDYPFEDAVRIEFEAAPAGPMPLLLRIPGWCRGARVAVNGRTADPPAAGGEFYNVAREWRAGDVVELEFDVPITLDHYAASWCGVPGVAVVRGPLTYTLPIPERWEKCGMRNAECGIEDSQPGEDWNVLPQEGAKWNVALELDLDHPERSLELIRLPNNAQSQNSDFKFQISNLKSEIPHSALRTPHLKCRARLLPGWIPDTIGGRPQTPALPPPPLRPEVESFDVELVPFALTHIRMTYLPVLGHEQTQRTLVNQGKA